MRILITGGAGFIGSHLVEHYHKNADVVVLDNFRSGYRGNLDNLNCTLIEGCITDPDIVNQAMQDVDYVFHLAAMISVPESMGKPIECNHINANGLLNVLETASAHGVKKLVLASSAAIYGDNPIVPKTEVMTPEPKSPYAITKLDGEYYLDMFAREGRIQTTSLRFFNVFGPRQDPKSAYAAAVPIFIEKAFANEDINIFGDGEQTRDFIYVKDITAALAHAAKCTEMTGSYNVGYGKSITINQLASEIIELAGSKSKILHGPTRTGDVKHSRASIDKILSSGFLPSSSLKQGLQETLKSVE